MYNIPKSPQFNMSICRELKSHIPTCFTHKNVLYSSESQPPHINESRTPHINESRTQHINASITWVTYTHPSHQRHIMCYIPKSHELNVCMCHELMWHTRVCVCVCVYMCTRVCVCVRVCTCRATSRLALWLHAPVIPTMQPKMEAKSLIMALQTPISRSATAKHGIPP